MNLIKARYMRNEVPSGRPYTFATTVPVEVDDLVVLDGKGSVGIVVETDVDEKEIEAFRDKLKTIVGKVEQKKEITDQDGT